MKKLIFDYARKAKSCSYGGIRLKKNIVAIVIHNTSDDPNAHDTAKNNADYFATGNTRNAGAHIFIDRYGMSARSIPLNRTAWSVGNPKGAYKRGAYYSTVNNANSVSIELCDIADQPISDDQRVTLLDVCRWIKKYCPNIRCVIRHYDVVQKNCPAYYIKNQKEWLRLQKDIMKAIGLM